MRGLPCREVGLRVHADAGAEIAEEGAALRAIVRVELEEERAQVPVEGRRGLAVEKHQHRREMDRGPARAVQHAAQERGDDLRGMECLDLQQGLRQDGHTVDWLRSAEGVEPALAVTPYEILLLDLGLPGRSGVAVLDSLRRSANDIPVLVITARDAVADRIKGLDSGADDYLVKPFAVKELLARLRALGRRGTEVLRSPVLCLGDLRLNPTTHQVTRGARAVKLTAKEYAILECLLREPGRMLTRKVIAEHVWSYDSDYESNVIDVYIRNLRRKIDDGEKVKLIHTVRGAGYRLAEDADELV